MHTARYALGPRPEPVFNPQARDARHVAFDGELLLLASWRTVRRGMLRAACVIVCLPRGDTPASIRDSARSERKSSRAESNFLPENARVGRPALARQPSDPPREARGARTFSWAPGTFARAMDVNEAAARRCACDALWSKCWPREGADSHPTLRSCRRAQGIGRQSRDDSSYEDRLRTHRRREYRLRRLFSPSPLGERGPCAARPDGQNEIPHFSEQRSPPFARYGARFRRAPANEARVRPNEGGDRANERRDRGNEREVGPSEARAPVPFAHSCPCVPRRTLP